MNAAPEKSCPTCEKHYSADAQFCPTDGAELVDVDPYLGEVIAGDIELLSVLGRGAMGRVYRAHQKSVGRDVAVKVLHRELTSNADLVQRFKREAKFASKLSHPHVVEVFLAGQLADGSLYIVMEYLDGESLASALQKAGALPIERALGISLQICDAVGEAHASGVVHRDLKPENVMLVRRADTADWAKVLDFGIAKGMLGEQSVATAAGQIFGTARYISPEAARGEGVGPPSDVYSIAVMMFQMFAGHTPFDANDAIGLLVRHLSEAPPPLREAAPKVPEAIARVVMDNLDKSPTKRSPNARALGVALAAAANAAGVAVPDVGPAARMSRVDGASSPPLPLREISDTLVAPTKVSETEPLPILPRVVPPTSVPPSERKSNEPSKTDETRDAGSSKGHSTLRLVAFVVVAILVTATAAAVYAARGNGNAEHDAFVAKAQQAFVDRHYVAPAGSNVHDLVESGLVKWPGDPTLAKLRIDAARELAETATAAHSGGDIEGASSAAKKALLIEPNDYAAKMLVDQYAEELATLESAPNATSTRQPCVLFTVPAATHVKAPFDAVAHVFTRSAGAHATIDDVHVKMLHERNADGTALPVDANGAVFTTHVTPTESGRFYLRFEASVGGKLLRAERAIDAQSP